MRTVSQAVEEHIMRSPYLSDVVADGIANNAEIARKIQPQIEKRLLESVSIGSISMALHRLSKNLQKSSYGADMIKKISGITVRSNLVQFIIPNETDFSELEMLSKISQRREDIFFNFSRGLHESILIVSKELEDDASMLFAKKENIKKISGLSTITMKLPENSLDVPGLYYPLLKAIAQEGISLVEVMSVRTEFSILFEDRDIERAFSVIKRVTSRN